ARTEGRGDRPGRDPPDHPRAEDRQYRGLHGARRRGAAGSEGAPATRQHRRLDRRARFAQALQGRRPRGPRGLRVRPVAEELQRHQGRRPARGVRDQGGRAHAVRRAAGVMTIHRPGGVSRSVRVTEQVHHELAELVRAEVKDPRVGMVTITGVELTPDYAYATVYFSVLPDDEATVANTLAGLRHAA